MMSNTRRSNFICALFACLFASLIGLSLNQGGTVAHADAGNNYDTATELKLTKNESGDGGMSAKVTEGLTTSSDIYDWFYINLPSDGYVVVKVVGSKTRGPGWVVRFYSDNASNELLKWTITSQKSNTSEKIGLTTGKYHFKINLKGNPTYRDGTYSLMVDFTPSPNWEGEYNDTVAKADEIQVGEQYYGTSSVRLVGGDSDYFAFTITEPGLITVDFASLNEPGIGGWHISLCDGFGVKMGGAWYVEAFTSFTTGNYVLPAGNYYFLVSGYGNGMPPYAFTVNLSEVPENYEMESNDTPAEANVIELNEEYRAASGTNGSEDWFFFSVPERGVISLSFKHAEIDFDKAWSIAFIQIDGQTPVSAPSSSAGIYDYSKYWYSVKGQEDLQTCNYGVGSGGYYLCVKTLVSTVEDYYFTVSFTPTDGWETEYNGTADKANEFSVADGVKGVISAPADTDCFKFFVPEDGFFEVSLSYPASLSSTVWELFLLDGNGVRLSFGYIWTGDSNSGIKTTPYGVSAGYYMVVVSQSSSGENSRLEYSLSVDVTPTAEWETESNNTPENADKLQFSKKINGTICKQDTDCFTFSVDISTSVSLTIFKNEGQSGEGAWGSVKLFNGSTVLQVQDIPFEGSTFTTEYFPITKGVYCFSIMGGDDVGAAEYSVVLAEKHEHTGEWKMVDEPSCEGDGIERRVCELCGLEETRPITAHGHTYGEFEITEKSGILKKGMEARVCSVCGKVDERETEGKPWLLAVIIGGAIVLIFGGLNYIRMLRAK